MIKHLSNGAELQDRLYRLIQISSWHNLVVTNHEKIDSTGSIHQRYKIKKLPSKKRQKKLHLTPNINQLMGFSIIFQEVLMTPWIWVVLDLWEHRVDRSLKFFVFLLFDLLPWLCLFTGLIQLIYLRVTMNTVGNSSNLSRTRSTR